MLRDIATATIAIRRAALATGKRDPATATTVLSGLMCTPLSAADVNRLGALIQNGLIQSVSQIFETVIIGVHDVQVNDLAVVGDATYLVVAVAAWPTIAATHVTLERVLQ